MSKTAKVAPRSSDWRERDIKRLVKKNLFKTITQLYGQEVADAARCEEANRHTSKIFAEMMREK